MVFLGQSSPVFPWCSRKKLLKTLSFSPSNAGTCETGRTLNTSGLNSSTCAISKKKSVYRFIRTLFLFQHNSNVSQFGSTLNPKLSTFSLRLQFSSGRGSAIAHCRGEKGRKGRKAVMWLLASKANCKDKQPRCWNASHMLIRLLHNQVWTRKRFTCSVDTKFLNCTSFVLASQV